MPTLSELAKSQQTTSVPNAQSVSTQSAGGTNIQATKQIDNNAGLVGDIGKLFGVGMKQHQDASEYAGKRVGNDNFVQYKKIMGDIAAEHNANPNPTSAEQLARTNTEQGVYEHFLQKGAFADNALANQAFIDTYASPAYDVFDSQKKANATNYKKLFQKETKESTTNTIEVLGADISKKNLDTLETEWIAAGLDPNGVTELYIGAAGQSWQIELNTNHDKYYDEGGNINQEAVDAKLNEMYKHVLDSDNETIQGDLAKIRNTSDIFIATKAGKVEAEYVTNAANLGRASMWKGKPYTDKDGVRHYYAKNLPEYERNIRRDYPLLKVEARTAIINRYKLENDGSGGSHNHLASDYVARTNALEVKNIDEFKLLTDEELADNQQEAAGLETNPQVTESRQNSVKRTREKMERKQVHLEIVNEDVATLSPEDLRTLAVKGSKDYTGASIDASVYRGVIQNNIDDAVTRLDANPLATSEDRTTFRKDLNLIKDRNTSLNKSMPAAFTEYENSISDTSGKLKGVPELRQIAEYMNYRLDTGDADKQYYKREIAQLNQILYAKKPDGSPEDEVVIARNGNSFLQSVASNTLRVQTLKVNLNVAKEEVDLIADGQSSKWFVGQLQVQNLPMPANSASSLMNIYKGSGSKKSIIDHVNSFKHYDVGEIDATNFFDKQRLFVPNGMEENEFEQAIGAVLKDANIIVTKDGKKVDRVDSLNENDLDFDMYDDGYNIYYRVLDKSQNYLGTISADGYQRVKGKSE